MNDFNQKLTGFFKKFPQQNFSRGEVLLRAEDEPPGVFFLRKGYVRFYSINEDGKELTLNIFKPGSCFPLNWAVADQPNYYFFEAMTEAEIIRAPKGSFLKFLKNEPGILYEYFRRILVGLSDFLIRSQFLLLADARKKVTATILLLARRFNQSEKDTSVKISLRLTHQEIANLAGLTRETTSLQLEALKKEGLIFYRHQQLKIPDLDRLKETALIYQDEKLLPYAF
ncbi:MAG: Crp/Fnr family transcriptional regulator [Candidatus Pacebacteria bacterium]|nr:Crp/Fnr family transcriptional regulator [Candidatus Paceibacterota bacterium]